MEKMLHTDVLVFATPIYCYEMSGQMKTIVAYNYGAKKAKENLPELQMGDALFCDLLQYIFPDNGGFSGMGAVIV